MPTITSSEFQHNNYLVEGHNKKVQNTIRCGGRGSLDRHTWDVVLDPQRRVRRLTALECWRFMGFDDSDFIKAKQSGVSDSQLYKQAGNSIVVDVLEKIFIKMFLEQEKQE